MRGKYQKTVILVTCHKFQTKKKMLLKPAPTKTITMQNTVWKLLEKFVGKTMSIEFEEKDFLPST